MPLTADQTAVIHGLLKAAAYLGIKIDMLRKWVHVGCPYLDGKTLRPIAGTSFEFSAEVLDGIKGKMAEVETGETTYQGKAVWSADKFRKGSPSRVDDEGGHGEACKVYKKSSLWKLYLCAGLTRDASTWRQKLTRAVSRLPSQRRAVLVLKNEAALVKSGILGRADGFGGVYDEPGGKRYTLPAAAEAMAGRDFFSLPSLYNYVVELPKPLSISSPAEGCRLSRGRSRARGGKPTR